MKGEKCIGCDKQIIVGSVHELPNDEIICEECYEHAGKNPIITNEKCRSKKWQ